ncbi:MAG TPA: ATP-dependent helicase, partial [Actinomycetota bacterium]|nr:ATP-dependent helicase [Actinomycetota bacterium]
MRLESEQFATFVPADPPRAGALAVWGHGQGPDELDLVLPVGGGMRRRRVLGRLVPLASALPALLAPTSGGAGASVAAWSAAAAAGVGLVARGRL